MAHSFTTAVLLLLLMFYGVSCRRPKKSRKALFMDSIQDYEHMRGSCRLICRKPPASLCVENSNGKCFCQCIKKEYPCPPAQNSSCPSGSPPTCRLDGHSCFCKCW
ncbi:uncharacterized protein LOC142790165 [Rhipicephalus microplus]|uniref:uncharacterized protein LOC142790165 n=1 Tax=Rhipicephalus microplus TaxID=6941 RepID=UPI003F6AB23D